MQVDTLTFHCSFLSEAILPPYKGSTLRGGFGHALRRTCCGLRRRSCAGCILAAACCYAIVFESERLDGLSGGYSRRLASRPHPYVLEPPLDPAREYAAGDTFAFTMHLFGPARGYRPQIVHAVLAMGEAGIGKRDGGRFRLDRVTAADTLVYDAATGRLSLDDVSRPLLCPPPDGPCDRLDLLFLTPLRVKRENRFARHFDFATVVRAALRRVSTLENIYGNGEPEIDYPGLCRRADTVRVIRRETGWIDIPRYSNRQKQAMQMGGIVGRVSLAGDLAPFVPFLRYCETVHIGKQTAFGLGWIRLEGLAAGPLPPAGNGGGRDAAGEEGA